MIPVPLTTHPTLLFTPRQRDEFNTEHVCDVLSLIKDKRLEKDNITMVIIISCYCILVKESVMVPFSELHHNTFLLFSTQQWQQCCRLLIVLFLDAFPIKESLLAVFLFFLSPSENMDVLFKVSAYTKKGLYLTFGPGRPKVFVSSLVSQG